ncbi:MAG: hypothetical protein WCG97_03940 [bacterium]
MTIEQAKQRVNREGGLAAAGLWETHHMMAHFSWSEGLLKIRIKQGCPHHHEGGKNKFEPKKVLLWYEQVFILHL